MNTIEIRVTESVTVANFAESLAKGDVQFYKIRANGTSRHIPVFAEGTKEFQSAEWVQEQREEGRSMKDIAAELHLSVPSVRRLINSYLLSDEVAGYDAEEIAELLNVEDAEPTTEPERVIGQIVAPSDEAKPGDPVCQTCGDVLEEGNICWEDFGKWTQEAFGGGAQ